MTDAGGARRVAAAGTRRRRGGRAAFGAAWTALALAAATLAAVPAPAGADEVAAYLERAGLDELLAVHLEERLESATGDERKDLVVRLAHLYADLLETTTDAERRGLIEERSRSLLREAEPGTAVGLRLALLRASYRTAERVAERHRLRLAADGEVEAARAQLADLVPELTRLARQTGEMLEIADRRLSRASGGDAIVQAENVEEARRLHAQATFLAAWGQYYQSWLNDRPDNARVAQQLFAELLDVDEHAPIPEDVSVDLRSTEALARCILGYALCKSLTATSAVALRWVSLLEHERTYPPLREEVTAWKIAICLEHDEFLMAQGLLDQRAAEGGEIPVEWLRLAAVGGIEAEARSPYATALVRYAVTGLAARGELDQIFDLAERYGADAVGTSGFALRYVHGVLRYKEARDAHGAEEPTSDPDLVAAYAEALESFRAAREQRDADRHPAALADCNRLIAWCLFFQGELRAAREAFEAAAKGLSADASADARWMAIVCLDLLVQADPDNVAMGDDLARMIQRFLDEFPASEHAPKLILRRALASDEVSPDLAEELLAIPPNSDVYEAARRRAAQILYRLFRDASDATRNASGLRFLDAAVPICTSEAERLDAGDPAVLAAHVVLGRRILEVALSDGIVRLEPARAVLDGLAGLAETAPDALAGLDGEIAYRRLQERLLSGDLVEAGRIADALWGEDPAAVWARLGSRAMFKDARRRWREADEEPAGDDRAAVAAVYAYGSRILEEWTDEQGGSDPAAIAYLAAVAEAAMTSWERSRDPQRGREALDLHRRLLAARPRNARFLRATAVLAERLGEPALAIDCWRTLLAGLGMGEAAWYEAKFHLVDLLAVSDPPRALAVLEQLGQLDPNYGPEPWGARLRAIHVRLAAETAEETPAERGGGDGPHDAVDPADPPDPGLPRAGAGTAAPGEGPP